MRKIVTHAVPNQRRAGSGDTRKDAMAVPRTNAPTMPHRQMPNERRNPDQNRSRLSVTASTRVPSAGEVPARPVVTGRAGGSDQAHGSGSGSVGVSVPSISPAVDAQASL